MNKTKVNYRDRIMLTRHLATMLKSGITLVEALDILEKENRNKKMKRVFGELSKDIESGKSLSDAMAKYPNIFNSMYKSLVKIGEKSGKLDESLGYMADQLEKENELRQKLMSAMMYPALVILATGVMGGFISIFILPKLVDFFGAFEIELPMTTKILLSLANFMKNYGLWLFSILIFIFGLLTLLSKTKKGKEVFDSLVIRVPFVGKLTVYYQLSQIFRNLGTLLNSGITLNDGIGAITESMTNTKFKKDLELIEKGIDRGDSVKKSMIKTSWARQSMLLLPMMEVGTKTGKIEESFVYLGDYYDKEIETVSKRFSTMLEPALLLLIGLVVGFVALAIISPIYELTGSIRRN